MERPTFDKLVLELCTYGLLEDGQSVSVEEQVLIFLDIVCHNNAMRQTAVKFCRGLYTVNRSVFMLDRIDSSFLTCAVSDAKQFHPSDTLAWF
jgi:hypothetical protein